MAKITKKEVSFEEVIRDMTHQVIAEELLREGYYGLPGDFDAWKTRTEMDEPGWPGPEYQQPEDPEEVAFLQQYEDDPKYLEEPGAEMDPLDRELMMNSLLDMEMTEGTAKKIPLGVLRRLIRESVRNQIKNNKK